MGCSVTAERTSDPLETSVSHERFESVISIAPFTFSTHMHLYFFKFQCVLRVAGVITGYFYFVIVSVCLFLSRQACRYLLIYVISLFCLFSVLLNFEAISISFGACFTLCDSCTCTL